MTDTNGNPILCPFCGGETYLYDGMLGYQSVRCRQCWADCQTGIPGAKWTPFQPHQPKERP
jgi:hypothetical protein